MGPGGETFNLKSEMFSSLEHLAPKLLRNQKMGGNVSRRRRIAGGVLEGSVCLHFPRQLLLASLSTKETSIKSPTGWLLTPVMLPAKKKFTQQ